MHGHHKLLAQLKPWHAWPQDSRQEGDLFLRTVQAGHANILAVLLQEGKYPSASNLGDLVTSAARKRHNEVLSTLLCYEAKIRSSFLAKREFGFEDGTWECILLDALFSACKNGDVNSAMMLLNHHPEKNAVNMVDATYNSAPTAMHHACSGGSVEMVRLLIAAGAQYRILDTNPLLFLAITNGHFGNPYNTTFLTLVHGLIFSSSDLVKELVEELAFDINQEGPSGSAITKAAAGGHSEILQYLLNRPECLLEGRLESAMSAAWYNLQFISS